jgi:putative hemolysin
MGRDLLAQALTTDVIDLKSIMQPALFVPDGALVLSVLEKFKQAKTQVALVSDEHGTLLGLMTLNDLLETIVGDVPELGDDPDPTAVQREDGSWLVDGRLSVDDFKELFGVKVLPDENNNFYETMGGFALVYLGRVPTVGERFEWEALQFEIMDMDWRRVDKLLVTWQES